MTPQSRLEETKTGEISTAIELSPSETEQFEEAESTIQESQECVQRSWYKIGMALLAVRKNPRWYRSAGYVSFDAYCDRRWQFGRSYANRLILATETRELLALNARTHSWDTSGENNEDKQEDSVRTNVLVGTPHANHELTAIPTSEGQIRPLNPLPVAQKIEAWRLAQDNAASEGVPVTSRHVADAVATLTRVEDRTEEIAADAPDEEDYEDADGYIDTEVDEEPASAAEAHALDSRESRAADDQGESRESAPATALARRAPETPAAAALTARRTAPPPTLHTTPVSSSKPDPVTEALGWVRQSRVGPIYLWEIPYTAADGTGRKIRYQVIQGIQGGMTVFKARTDYGKGGECTKPLGDPSATLDRAERKIAEHVLSLQKGKTQ